MPSDSLCECRSKRLPTPDKSHPSGANHFRCQLRAELTFQLDVDVWRDNWISGGAARYDVKLTRIGDQLAGTYSGVFAATPPLDPFSTKGKVTGIVLPPEVTDPQWKPFEPGEHPRMLFRTPQLPALREKAKTPFGLAMIQKIKANGDAVSLGFLYQMTGDKEYAERAFTATVETMNNRNGGPFALGRFWGYRTSVVGTAYDLCYDAWTPEQRERVQNYLDWILFKCEFRKHRVGTVNWEP